MNTCVMTSFTQDGKSATILTSMHGIQKTQKVRGTCILDGYHTCAPGEMETCIRHDDETFKKDPFSSGTWHHDGFEKSLTWGSITTGHARKLIASHLFELPGIREAVFGEVSRRGIFLLREHPHHTGNGVTTVVPETFEAGKIETSSLT